MPSFISTFAAPRPAIPTNSLISVVSSLPYSTHVGVNTSLSSLPSAATLQQPFVVGPGFSAIPAKTVSQILAGKYVDLCDLLSANIVHTEPESTVLLDGHLVFAPSTKKKSVTDRGYWHLVRSLHDFFDDSDLALPSSLERSDVLQVAHSTYTPAICRASLASIR